MHGAFPVCNYDGQMTVWDDGNYSQFLKYDKDTKLLSVLDTKPPKTDNFLLAFIRKLKRFAEAFFVLIKQLFEK